MCVSSLSTTVEQVKFHCVAEVFFAVRFLNESLGGSALLQGTALCKVLGIAYN